MPDAGHHIFSNTVHTLLDQNPDSPAVSFLLLGTACHRDRDDYASGYDY